MCSGVKLNALLIIDDEIENGALGEIRGLIEYESSA